MFQRMAAGRPMSGRKAGADDAPRGLDDKDRSLVRVRAEVHGAVQGVGFRPFVYRLATELGLVGWASNSTDGAVIEVEGTEERVQQFLGRLRREKPRQCTIDGMEPVFLRAAGYARFDLRESNCAGEKTAVVLPDLATCAECVREVFDPSNRRYRYPFTNCTNCGPRFSILEALPYDRSRTTMKGFALCGRCRVEYESPADRRFHAQPNACPECGPHLELWDEDGKVRASRDAALLAAATAVRRGEIVAVKGLGGFHLIADAGNEDAVCRLRQRKRREEKPFALMYPDLEAVRRDCRTSTAEEDLLLSSQAPIVLLRRRSPRTTYHSPLTNLAGSVAPRNPYLGVMLPYTPVHHLLLVELGLPVVATSGNRREEPICTDEREALTHLAGIADCFLVHNRPIVRHVDDSVVRVVLGRELVLRRARGYAPLPVRVKQALPPMLAVGAQLKNTVALAVGDQIIISQHIGDLETASALAAFQRAWADMAAFYNMKLQALACDMHPDYLSTRAAQKSALAQCRPVPVVPVQHHHAHVRACMAENELCGPVLGVSWDGTGYGPDGTVWGGEFLRVAGAGFERVAYLRTFRLPGGDQAVREPRRAALGLLHELFGDDGWRHVATVVPDMFVPSELNILRAMLQSGLNAPRTSSAGRLFDAVAALLGLCPRARFEGQAAMELEFTLDGVDTDETYPFSIDSRGVIDWGPMVQAILREVRSEMLVGQIAAKFHNTLVEIIVAVSRRVGERAVVLTGGCFQNAYLLEHAVRRLRNAGFEPYWHQRVPPNDGGIALGQIMAAAVLLHEE
jgi:hydrogenase maturation protein HypF